MTDYYFRRLNNFFLFEWHMIGSGARKNCNNDCKLIHWGIMWGTPRVVFGEDAVSWYFEEGDSASWFSRRGRHELFWEGVCRELVFQGRGRRELVFWWASWFWGGYRELVFRGRRLCELVFLGGDATSRFEKAYAVNWKGTMGVGFFEEGTLRVGFFWVRGEIRINNLFFFF